MVNRTVRGGAGRRRKLDRFDMAIMKAVSEDGRQTITEISKSVNLSANPCTTRLERLESEKLILGYRADINFENLADLSLYYVTIEVKSHTPEFARKLEMVIAQNPYIVSADAIFGSIDYILRVFARNAQHYHEIMEPLISLEISYQTWPVSRTVVRGQARLLIDELAKTAGS